MKDIVFYSKKCRPSIELLKLMDHLPRNGFIGYCVDRESRKEPMNRELLEILELERTPTVYYKGQKYVGVHALQLVKGMLGNVSKDPVHDRIVRHVSEPVNGTMRLTPVPSRPQKVQQEDIHHELETVSSDGFAPLDFGDDSENGFTMEMPMVTKTSDAVIGENMDTSALLRQLEEQRKLDVPLPDRRVG